MEVRILPLQLGIFVPDAPIHTVQTTPGAPQGGGFRADGASAETFADGRRKESACTGRVANLVWDRWLIRSERLVVGGARSGEPQPKGAKIVGVAQSGSSA